MAASVSVGQRVASPSATANSSTPAAVAKTGTVLATGLNCAVATATGKGGVTYGTSNTGVQVQWDRQPQLVIHPVADLT